MTISTRDTAPREDGARAAQHIPSSPIEVRGIDFIPDDERHGRAFDLFWVWMGSNVNYLSFTFGGLLILIGLSVWEAIIVTLLGSLWWVAVGWLSVSGPASGTPSVTVMRAMFGIRGNRIFGAGQGLVIGLFYEIINITVATFATLALLEHVGVHLPANAGWAVLLVIALLSFVLSVYGYDAIVKASPYFSAALALAFVVLGFFVFSQADYGYTAEPLEPGDHWAALLLGYAIVASGPLSWGTGADYSRYLPARTSMAAVGWWTALGGVLPTLFISVIGIFAATAIDMTDPQLTIHEIVPSWFVPVFLGIVIVGCITNNALVGYSAGLSAQGLGFKASRFMMVLITGLIATAAAYWLTFLSSGFLDTMEYALELTVTILGPLMAIYAVDIFVRRNRYDGIALNDERPGAPFWYSAGWFWPGVIAQLAGTAVALLMVNTTLYLGPIAQALNGADLSAIVAPVLAGALYAVLWRTTAPFDDPTRRPGGARDHQGVRTPEHTHQLEEQR